MHILNLKLNQRELDVGPTESVALRRDDNIALEVAPADWALEAGYPALGHPRALDSRVLHARDEDGIIRLLDVEPITVSVSVGPVGGGDYRRAVECCRREFDDLHAFPF